MPSTNTALRTLNAATGPASDSASSDIFLDLLSLNQPEVFDFIWYELNPIERATISQVAEEMNAKGSSQFKHNLENANRFQPPVTVRIPLEAFSRETHTRWTEQALSLPKDPDTVFRRLDVDMSSPQNVPTLSKWLQGTHFMPDATISVKVPQGESCAEDLMEKMYGLPQEPSRLGSEPGVLQIKQPTWNDCFSILDWSARRCIPGMRNPYYIVMNEPRPDASVGYSLRHHNPTERHAFFRRGEEPDMVLLLGSDLTYAYTKAESDKERQDSMHTMADMVADLALSQACPNMLQSNKCYIAIKPGLGFDAYTNSDTRRLDVEQERELLSALQARVYEVITSEPITHAYKERNSDFARVSDAAVHKHFLGRLKFCAYDDVQSMLADPLAERLAGILGDDTNQDILADFLTQPSTRKPKFDRQIVKY